MQTQEAKEILWAVVRMHELSIDPSSDLSTLAGYLYEKVRFAYLLTAEELFRKERAIYHWPWSIERRSRTGRSANLVMVGEKGKRRLHFAIYDNNSRIIEAGIPLEGQPSFLDPFTDRRDPLTVYPCGNAALHELDIARNWRGARWIAANLLKGLNPVLMPEDVDNLSVIKLADTTPRFLLAG